LSGEPNLAVVERTFAALAAGDLDRLFYRLRDGLIAHQTMYLDPDEARADFREASSAKRSGR
jgi:hypothetical protein